jgi:hypothetical protein
VIPHAEHWFADHARQDGAFDPADIEGEGEGLVAEDLWAFNWCVGGSVGEGVGGCRDEAGAVEVEGLRRVVGGPGVEEDVQVRVEVDVGEL